MKEALKTSLVFAAALMFFGCQFPDGSTAMAQRQHEPKAWDKLLPAIQDSSALVVHKAYTLEYSEKHEQALWVAYLLTRDYVKGQEPRTNDFRPDESVRTQSAQLEDYRHSGYSRGHLCPAGDMKWDREAMSETFFLSNMSPQIANFNDGIWQKMEGKARHFANVYDSIYIITGPVLTELIDTIGENCVSVPAYYYKIIYNPANNQSIAFLVPHKASNESIKRYLTTIDEIEKMTGLDFFPQLPDDIEERMESRYDLSQWKW